MPSTWQALYESHVVSVFALAALPVLFLGGLVVRGIARDGGIESYAARFVRG